mgnify:FL=1
MSRAGAFVLALAACCTLLASSRPASAPAENDEYTVKAAFLYNFTKYVKWPADALEKEDTPIVVAVLGTDPFGKKLDDAFKGKLIGKHPLSIVRWKTIDELSACHLLFVPATEAERLGKIVDHYAKSHTLLVGEFEGFAEHKGCLNFYIEDKKVRFEANAAAAKRAELEISPQLLKLARLVKEP